MIKCVCNRNLGSLYISHPRLPPLPWRYVLWRSWISAGSLWARREVERVSHLGLLQTYSCFVTDVRWKSRLPIVFCQLENVINLGVHQFGHSLFRILSCFPEQAGRLQRNLCSVGGRSMFKQAPRLMVLRPDQLPSLGKSPYLPNRVPGLRKKLLKVPTRGLEVLQIDNDLRDLRQIPGLQFL